MASQKQLDFISRLCEERQVDLDTFEGFTVDETMTNRQVDGVLAYLKALPRPARQETKAERQAAEEGMYRMNGEIYRVVIAHHGSGRPYARRLVVTPGATPEETSVEFERAPGVVFRLRPEHRMSLEEAKAFGALYGTCCVCGRTLTNETSISEGIGPVCSGKV